MSKPTLSVVIPVANMAGKLQNFKKTLSTLDDNRIEVIVVDDKQDINTGLELRDIREEFPKINIKIIEGTFGNPGTARNAGLEVATGKWITFWDSDDLGFISGLMESLENVDPAIRLIIGQYEMLDVQFPNKILRPRTRNLREFSKSPGIWRLVFQNSHLTQFPSLSMGEDLVFIMENFPEPFQIAFSSEVFYRYIVGNDYQLTRNSTKTKDLLQARLMGKRIFLNRNKVIPFGSIYARMTFSCLKYIKNMKSIFATLDLIFSFAILRPLHRFNHRLLPHKFGENWVSLTGGLGNQLFQLAAASSLSQESKLNIIYNLGSPRKNKLGYPDITDFELSGIVYRDFNHRFGFFSKKIAGFNLRRGINPRKFEQTNLIDFIIRKLSNLYFTYSLLQRIKLVVCIGVGYFDPKVPPTDNLFIGYFQSYKWVSNDSVLEKFKSLELKHPSIACNKYRLTVKNKRVLGVHIRLGDYKAESDFGVLSPSYYAKAIELALAKNSYDVVWVFSDEPQLAKKYYANPTLINANWIEDNSLSPAETLQLFRRCDGFVIANSSFSWWAAMLSENENAEVIAPSEWFLRMEDPVDLLPPHWNTIQPEYLAEVDLKQINAHSQGIL